MRLSILVLSVLPATWPLVSANPIPDAEIPEGYSVDTLQWEVQAFPDGEFVTLNGTIEEIREELLQLNPNWDEDFLNDLPDEDEDEDFLSDDPTNALSKRTDFYDAKTVCNKFSSSARGVPITKGIKYLRGVKGKPNFGPGPARCGRVSCSYDSGIWWCNDSKNSKTLNSFGSIADGAAQVVRKCGVSPVGSIYSMVNGQAFHKTNWNVYVRGANCWLALCGQLCVMNLAWLDCKPASQHS